MAKFIHFGMILTNQNSKVKKCRAEEIHEVFAMTVSEFLSSHLPSKVKIHKNSTATFVFEGCETQSLPLREEHGLRMLNKVLRKILGIRWEAEGKCIMSFMMRTAEQSILVIKSVRIRVLGHVTHLGG